MRYIPNNYKEMSYEPPDAGMCKVDIIDAELVLKKNGPNAGDEQIKIKCEVCEGQKGAGFRLYQYLSAGEYFESTVGSIFKSCGLDVPKSEVEITADTFNGKGMSGTVMLQVKEYPINSGKMKPEIWYWIKPQEVAAEQKRKEEEIPF